MLFNSEILYYICSSKHVQTFCTSNKCMKKNRIEISVVHKKELKMKYVVSLTTVQQALDFYNNSELAKKIRASAKELLLIEVEKIKD